MYLHSFLVSLVLVANHLYAQVVLKTNCEDLEESIPAAIDDMKNCEVYRAQCKSNTICSDCEIDGTASTLGCWDGCEYIWESQGVRYSVKRGISATRADFVGGHIGQLTYLYEFADGMTGSYAFQANERGDYCFAWFNGVHCTCQAESCGYQVDCSDIEGGISLDYCTYQTPKPNNTQEPMELLLTIPAFACDSLNPSKPDDNGTETTECALECTNGVFEGIECDTGYIPNQYNNGYDYTDNWGECHRNSCCAPDSSFCCMPEFEGSDCQFCPGNSFIFSPFVLCPSGKIYDPSKVGNYFSRLVPTCDFNVCCTTDPLGTDCCIDPLVNLVDDAKTDPPSPIHDCTEYCNERIWNNVICEESEYIVLGLFGNFTDATGSCSYCACCAADIDECCTSIAPIPGMPASRVCPWSMTTTTPLPISNSECTKYCNETSNGNDEDEEKSIWTDVSCEESGKVKNVTFFGNFISLGDESCSYNACCAVDIDDCCIGTVKPAPAKNFPEVFPPSKTNENSIPSLRGIINFVSMVSMLFILCVT